ncbi:hypothetical protein [Streptomyces pratensis]|uniref:hypothetical protein n=1 Tax=Streptomyces pratensis TaxID=1169025 RepID=UPI0030841A5C
MATTTARDIMTGGAQCVQAPRVPQTRGTEADGMSVDALPVCGGKNQLIGVITDRDIVVRVLG